MFVDEANHIYIVTSMYNYSDTSGRLWQFERDEPPADNADLDVVNNSLNSESFKYKAAL